MCPTTRRQFRGDLKSPPPPKRCHATPQAQMAIDCGHRSSPQAPRRALAITAPLSTTGGKTEASTPTASNKPMSQVPVRRETRPVVLAIDRSAVRTPVNSAHHRSGTSSALTPSDLVAAPAESTILRMRNTVLMCCGSTPVRAKSSSAPRRWSKCCAILRARSAVVLNWSQQLVVVVQEPDVHTPGCHTHAAGGTIQFSGGTLETNKGL